MILKHVRDGYRHYPKNISPGPMFDTQSACLKWYCLAKHGAPVEPEVEALAREFLHRSSARPDWSIDGDVGFAILHRCGDDFYFLIVCTWRGDNELWETVYYKPDSRAADFDTFPQGAHKGTFCVWEAGIVASEMKAWSRFLLSDRNGADMARYLSEMAAGEVV